MKKLFLLTIISLGFFLRVYKLDVRPLGFTWDEAALGYNAFSLLKTGRDEHAQPMPVIFKSFGDYKPGLYVYYTVPVIKILGLNEFATRLPSAIFGTLLIAVVYLLTRNIFASLLLAINPWAMHFSRGAWETNLNLLLTTLAVLLFIKKKYIFSAIFFGLTFWAYQGAKMFTPLLVVSLIIIYKPFIKKLFKPLLLLLLLLLPILVGVGSQSGRLKVFSVFSYTRPESVISEILRQDKTSIKNLTYYLFHSEWLDQGRGIVQRYLNHFSPRFLFIDGDWSNPRHSTPFYAYLHYPEILTLIIGLTYLLRSKSLVSKILFAWLLLAPLPSALSRDIISGVRSFPMVIPLVIISGIGLTKIFSKKILILLYSPALLLFFVYFLDLYFIHYPDYFAQDWLTPYQPAFEIVKTDYDKYQKIIFTTQLGQPYIFALFHLQFDPKTYQNSNQFRANPQGDVGQVDRFDKFEFRTIYWPSDRGASSTLFIGGQYELPEKDLNTPNLDMVTDINYPNGLTALRVVGVQ